MASEETAAARAGAPDLVARVESALDQADAAERANDDPAAADHTTRARLLLEAAEAETARIGDEQERRAIEARIGEVLERARRDEDARAAVSREMSRMAGARTAREEALRALALAEADEARGPRRGRVSLEDRQDIVRGAAALRARATLAIAAAVALGAPEEATRSAREAVAASAEERDPMLALRAADRAHHEALRAIGAARAALSGPGLAGPGALAEAARAEGFEVVVLPEGVAIEAGGLFRGNSAAVSGGPRVARLASLASAHPHGPIQVAVQVPQAGRQGDQLATRRAAALRDALVASGVPAERLTPHAIPAALRGDEPLDRARLIFVAYSVAPTSTPR